MEASNRRALSGLVHSFSVKLLVLAFILLSVPLILYQQFSHAEHEQEQLLINAVSQTNRVTAALLAPHFERFSSEPAGALQNAMARASDGHTRIKILMRLANAKPDNFIYVASMPPLPQRYLNEERAQLARSGIFRRLAPTCDGTTNLGLPFRNPAGTREVLMAMTPVHIGGNCWVVITFENAADLAQAPIGVSFWKTPAMRVAASIYLLSVVLLIWLFFHMWRNVSRFRAAARRIRLRESGPTSFRQLNTIPELARVTDDFDSLVDALVLSQKRIKETAEENSHALKTPLAVIAQSVEPLKRAISSSDTSAVRSLQLIERSVERLDAMVSAQRDLENASANLVYPARRRIDMSARVNARLKVYRETLATEHKHLVVLVDDGIMVLANDELVEPVIDNLMDNAASFTAEEGVIEVRLTTDKGLASFSVMDRGPGVCPELLLKIFERATSFRNSAPTHSGARRHQGLGLWIVKRNVEALGGKVHARNRTGRGLEVVVHLQLCG